MHLEPAEKTKSELYQDLLPLLNSRAVDLLDHDRLMMQLVSLERTTARGGRDKSTTRGECMMTLPMQSLVPWCLLTRRQESAPPSA